MSKYKHFGGNDQLACSCCGVDGLDAEFMAKLDQLREDVGFAMPVNSGYRCPLHNHKVSGTGFTGPHTTGKAVDIGISGGRATALVKAALNAGFLGVGIKQHGPAHGRIVHLDMVDRPEQIIWTY